MSIVGRRKMPRIEYLNGQDPLENEAEALEWLIEKESKIIQVQVYLAKAPTSR